MVGSVTQTNIRAGRADGSDALEEKSKSRLSLGRDGFSSLDSKNQGQHFLAQKGEEFRKLIDERKDEAADDVSVQPGGIFSLFAPQAPVVSPAAAIPPELQTRPADVAATVQRITELVRDFNLRDPLLASQSLSCSVNFADGFSVPTAVSVNGLGEMQVRISATEATFGLRSGLQVAALQETLAIRFPKHRLRIEFAGEDHDHA